MYAPARDYRVAGDSVRTRMRGEAGQFPTSPQAPEGLMEEARAYGYVENWPDSIWGRGGYSEDLEAWRSWPGHGESCWLTRVIPPDGERQLDAELTQRTYPHAHRAGLLQKPAEALWAWGEVRPRVHKGAGVDCCCSKTILRQGTQASRSAAAGDAIALPSGGPSMHWVPCFLDSFFRWFVLGLLGA